MRGFFRVVCISVFTCCLLAGTILTRIETAIAAGPPLPALGIKTAPELMPLPDIDVYVIADLDMDVAFYNGWWWRMHDNRWYRASEYNGAWGLVIAGKVPEIILGLHPGFRGRGLGNTRIPYGQFKKNWKRWEKEKRWHKAERKMEHREEKSRDRQDRNGRGQGHGGGKGRR
ncbi:MAG: hypothetical protein HZB85_08135 [Deltaproteobacteria bacterium]|nr:hypothetical protein [Deltaproteobacteria bacterium]